MLNKTILCTGIILINFFTFSQTVVLLEDFQSGLPNDWTIQNLDNNTAVDSNLSDAWAAIPDPDNTSDTIMASTSYFTPAGTADRWLITPPLTLGAFGNVLQYNVRSHDPSFPDGYLILVSTTDNQIASFTDTIGKIQQEFANWTTRITDLSEKGYDNQTIHIAFINNTIDGFKLYLDSVQITKDDPASIPTISTEVNFTVYPNPATNFVQVQTDASINKVTITSLTGSVVKTSNSKKIEVAQIPSGIYFLTIETNKGRSTKKFSIN